MNFVLRSDYVIITVLILMIGLLYCIGGTTGGENIFASAERYDTISNKWHNIAPMNKKRWGLAAVAFKGYIYAIGKSFVAVNGYNLRREIKFDFLHASIAMLCKRKRFVSMP